MVCSSVALSLFALAFVGGTLGNKNKFVIAPKPTTRPISYSDVDGTELLGHFAKAKGASKKNPKPTVVIIPDWNGNGDGYEMQRATMISQWFGWNGFAADIYGKDLQFVENIQDRVTQATKYRSNPALFLQRIQRAISLVKDMDVVDETKVALIGYCFGGTGVLIYAIDGQDGVAAVASFHGGLNGLQQPTSAIIPKILVLSGGDDDTSTQIYDLEQTLNTGTANWEITRYSNIQHAFTVFSDPRYNPMADMRSWYSMASFFSEAFGETKYMDPQPKAEMTIPIDYVDVDGQELIGYVASPDMYGYRTPSPAVIVIHDFDGVNKYEKERATMLASFGYVGFAADIYGANLQENLDSNMARSLAAYYRNNPDLFVQRIQRAVDLVKTFDFVDPENVAILGYCFGGTGVIEYAFDGLIDVKALVSFHGGLANLPMGRPDKISPYVLVLSGGVDDAFGNQTQLELALNEGNADWEITRYSNVEHSFTKWEDALGRYNLAASSRSFESTISLLEDIMPVPVKKPGKKAVKQGKKTVEQGKKTVEQGKKQKGFKGKKF